MCAFLQQGRNFYLHVLPVELRWLCQRLWPLARWQAASLICLIAGTGLTLLNPLILKWLIDDILPGHHRTHLIHAVGLTFLSHAGRAFFLTLNTYLTFSVSQKLSVTLRMELLKHHDNLSADFHEATPTGEKLHTMREPIDEIAYFASDLFPSLLRAFALFVLALYAMTRLNSRLTLFVLPLVPAFVIARHYFRCRLEFDAAAIQAHRSAFTAFLEEHLSSIIQVQLLGQQERREKVAFQFLNRAAVAQLQLARTGFFLTVATTISISAALSLALGYGGWSVLVGTMSIGSLVAYSAYLTQLFEPLALAAEMYARAQRTFASVRQIRATLALRPSVADPSSAVILNPAAALAVSFRGVRFRYLRPNHRLEIDFLLIPPGERLAIVGQNGAGKSTLGKLMARLYDPIDGEIRYGDVDLRKLHIKYVRSTIFYVPQHPILFDDTVAGNLRMANPSATPQEVDAALFSVGLDRLVSRFVLGANQPLGPSGCALSGGERQRLAISRAILRRPNVLILDEATSCLDPSGEALVFAAIKSALPHTTLIVISHRFANMNLFDRILLMADGKVEEISLEALRG